MHTVLATQDGQPLFLLAQGEAELPDATNEQTGESAESDGTTDDTGGGGLFSGPMLPLILGMMVLWIFLLGGGSRKQKKKQQALLASITKGSKVVTIGGIRGSVVEVRDDEVVVKVDENNNTRMKFSRDAIRSVADESAGKDKEEKEKVKESK